MNSKNNNSYLSLDTVIKKDITNRKVKGSIKIPPAKLKDAAQYAYMETEKWEKASCDLCKSREFDSIVPVLKMYAIELYFKSIIMYNGKQETGHDLSRLYKKLGSYKHSIKEGIEFDPIIEDEIFGDYVHFNSFEEELDYISNDFIFLRYDYEKFSNGYPIFILSSFIESLLKNARKVAYELLLQYTESK